MGNQKRKEQLIKEILKDLLHSSEDGKKEKNA